MGFSSGSSCEKNVGSYEHKEVKEVKSPEVKGMFEMKNLPKVLCQAMPYY